ncbi:MAG: hypothetical protein E7329_11180 [Clostridiales bacterium]|nr:hypothetical protein [Clostridiales bacterium]
MAILASNVPVKRQETNIAHGQVGEYAAGRMLLHPGKREKMPVGESLLSLPAFSRFHCAREIMFPFPRVSCGIPKVS